MGTLVPISALQSSSLRRKDNGTFAVGKPFLHWLKQTNQSAWQVLPLHENQLEEGSSDKHVPSPYKSYGIGLSPQYLDSKYAKKKPSESELQSFLKIHKAWLLDYALFCSLRDHFKTDDWRLWDKSIRNYQPEARLFWQEKLQNEMTFYITQQWQLHASYAALRKQAKKQTIALIGDLPFYPSVNSPLVWSHQSLFHINEDGSMSVVSGIPDLFGTHFGRQVWGHPLYRWEKKLAVTAFWKLRLWYLSQLFDWVRIDHAKGFFSYGVIDIDDETNDHYQKGPGSSVLTKLISYCQKLRLHIFVEDSGREVSVFHRYLFRHEIGGVKILRFLLKNKSQSVFVDASRAVAYTTTHDTETLIGYLHKVKPHRKKLLAQMARVTYSESDIVFAERLRYGLISSPAPIVIIPIQDWLLISERINIPGTERPINDPNWRFRVHMPIEELPTKFNT